MFASPALDLHWQRRKRGTLNECLGRTDSVVAQASSTQLWRVDCEYYTSATLHRLTLRSSHTGTATLERTVL